MGKLTCQDLMVGDWFKSVDYNSPFRITAIYDDVVQTQADYQSEIDGNWYSEVEIKDLVPIPLTEEILVKNGFEKSTRVGTYELNTDYYEIEVWDYSDGLWVVKVQYIEFSSLPYSQATITHVHALQHLFRLCGIEKELVID